MAGSNEKIRAFIDDLKHRSDTELHNIKIWCFDKRNEFDQDEWNEVTWMFDNIHANRFRAKDPVESSNPSTVPVAGFALLKTQPGSTVISIASSMSATTNQGNIEEQDISADATNVPSTAVHPKPVPGLSTAHFQHIKAAAKSRTLTRPKRRRCITRLDENNEETQFSRTSTQHSISPLSNSATLQGSAGAISQSDSSERPRRNMPPPEYYPEWDEVNGGWKKSRRQ